MKTIPHSNTWENVIFSKSTNFEFPFLFTCWKLDVLIIKIWNYKANHFTEKDTSSLFWNTKYIFQNIICNTVFQSVDG